MVLGDRDGDGHTRATIKVDKCRATTKKELTKEKVITKLRHIRDTALRNWEVAVIEGDANTEAWARNVKYALDYLKQLVPEETAPQRDTVKKKQEPVEFSFTDILKQRET